MNSPTTKLIEVFSAIQGEGLNVGTRQIFVRFALCDLRCYFCDSAHTWLVPEVCEIEQTPGLRDFQTHPNPVGLDDLLHWVERQNQPGLHDSISITGGEPLLHAPFLSEFLPRVRDSTGLPIYLETAGHRPQNLEPLLPYLDLVGMDIKLPSVSGETWWTQHQLFLQHCDRARVEVFVKLIIGDRTCPQELETTAQILAKVNPEIPVFLQPLTPLSPALKSTNEALRTAPRLESLSPSPEQVLSWQTLMKRQLKHVRVVPQTHKMLNQR